MVTDPVTWPTNAAIATSVNPRSFPTLASREARPPGLRRLPAVRTLPAHVGAAAAPIARTPASFLCDDVIGQKSACNVISAPSNNRHSKKPRRNAAGLILLRMICPAHIPPSAGTTASTDNIRLPGWKAP